MNHQRLYAFKALLVLLVLGSAVSIAQTTPSRVMVTMPDGVELATDLYIPEDAGPYPAILIRTPYDSRQYRTIAPYFAERGFATVVQNVRGKSGSGGQFVPFVYEKGDGLACLQWLEAQEWCNGAIGMWGESYLAYCGLVLTPDAPASFKTMINISGMGDMDWFINPGGAFHLMAHFPWFYLNVSGGQFPPWETWMQLFSTRPIVSLFGPRGVELAAMFRGIEDDYDKVAMPILHITGWYDFVAESTLRSYSGIVTAGNDRQRLIVGPWYHDQVYTGKAKVGDIDFGSVAERSFDELLELSVKWFKHYLSGEGPEPVNAPVEVFVMGANEWMDLSAWPAPAAQEQLWFIGNQRTLGTIAPKNNGNDSFVFDPDNPVPTIGGNNFHYFKDNLGILDQSEVQKREDVLVYTSAPLEQPLLVAGPMKAVLYAESEGVDTDFTAKVVELRPDGYARIIEEGIVRLSAAETASESGLQPGTVYRIEVEIGDIAIELPQGSRLQLEIGSSNFPKYNLNPNTGEDPMEAVEFRKVRQTVHFSPEYPTHLVLPVIQMINIH